MITYNLISAITMVFSDTTSFLFKNFDGTNQNWANRNLPSAFFSTDKTAKSYSELSSGDGMSLLLGSGTTPAVGTDYKLEAIESEYSVIVQNHNVFTGQYGNQIMVVNRVIQNISGSPITINEMGLFGYQILFAREVLSEPVVLQPGEKHTFTMTISLE